MAEKTLETMKLLLRTADSLSALADSVRALCATLTDSPQPTVEDPKIPEITLEQVRGLLAERSREGYTAGVRNIIQSFGAERLSEIDPSHYAEVLKQAEELPYG